MTVTSSKTKKERLDWAKKQFIKHHRHNLMFAKPGLHQCVVILDNLKPSFNIGKIFRSGDAFGIHEIHLIGIDYFPSTSAKGSFKWVPAYFHQDFEECYAVLKKREYAFFILEPTADKSIDQIKLGSRSAFVFGHEEHGMSFDQKMYPDMTTIRVPQYGRVESLNVSIAASIVMYEYLRQHSR